MKNEYSPLRLSPAEMWLEEEETQPLSAMRGLAFRLFLARHRLTLLDVASAAGVRMLTAWNIERDNPVTCRQAELVREALFRLTGVHYHGRIILRLEPLEYLAPTRPDSGIQTQGLRKGGAL